MAEFWEGEGPGFTTWMSESMTGHLAPKSIRAMLEETPSPQIEQFPAGLRVAFEGSLSSLLAYEDPPDMNVCGTVVTVRTATGNVTNHDGMVFVKWDDDRFMGVHAAHLYLAPSGGRRAGTSEFRRVVSSVGDLQDFFRFGSESTDLVHKATKDLWSLKKDGGEFVIERLFNESGKPLKV